MDRKVCIITGANSGIGKEAAIQIAREGYHVIIACRNKERGITALEDIKRISKSHAIELMLLDLSLKSSIKDFAEEVLQKYPVIDVLIHNAAIFDITQKSPRYSSEGIETIWATNHIGPVYLTLLLLDAIKASSQGRILTVSSKGLLSMPGLKVDLNDPEFKKRKFNLTKAYYQSKLAQVMYTYWLAKQLKNTPVTVNSIRVTAVQVDINRYANLSAFYKKIYSLKSKFSLTPEEMAKTYTYLATSSDVNHISGSYFDENNKKVGSSKYSHDSGHIDEIMKLTMSYINP
ncbi:SDR family NAD(P)-dependent oxidoreductase [Vallitalea okinawensis]|uniref:SDR family NAD(P)-dependent oxidoreductase n=1 Tax=Vallitalea okinawensis TaxID=2078660 RepID=UPI000CFC0B0C|nr:SDR family NAD(P)-dependent oxidoreductase [Vallitalea okinawensis]